MNVIAQKTDSKSSLGELARSYNSLRKKIYGRLVGVIGGSTILGVTALILAATIGTPGDSLWITVGYTGAAFAIASPMAVVGFANWKPKSLLAISEGFYSAAGIKVNPGFGKLIPGETVASFGHSFPDGRSGQVKVVCDEEGYPLILFTETGSSIILEAPAAEALPSAKQPLAIGAASRAIQPS